ncbi:MAG: T9SS type B sorting domain-containing protein [Cytophagales bacterium]|nr:T9SS type B sorting domain-containing protein [Cytophagales bacterium]
MNRQLREKRGMLKLCLMVLLSSLTFSSWAAPVETVSNLNANGAGSFAQALEDVNANGTINFQGGLNGTISVRALQIGKAMTINGNPGIIIDGGGAHKARPWLNNLMTIAASNVTINNLTFQNSTGDNPWDGHGVIMSDGLSDITFEDCTFQNNNQSGLSITDWVPAGQTPQGIQNLTITNCIATGNVLDGMQIVATDGVTVSGGSYHANTRGGIHFERGVINGVIDNVDVYENGLPATGNTNADNGAGIRVYDGGDAILQQSTKITISNCRIYRNNIHGIELPFNSDEVNVFRNEIYENGYEAGGAATPGNQANGVVFQFGGNDDCTVVENNIYDNRDAGIYMYRIQKNVDHSGNVFYNNTVTNNGGGIIILGSKSSFIANNVITGTTNQGGVPGGLNGIYFGFNSDDGVVYNNTVTGTAAGNGILVSDDGNGTNGSDNVYIFGNTLDDHNQNGIRVENSNDSHIGSTAGAATITRNIAGYGNITIGPYNAVEPNKITKTIHCIDVFNGEGVEIDGSFIGTADGIAAGTNTGNGVNIQECSDIRIGVIERNIISGNPSGYGIYITKSTDIQIHKNYIGLNEAGDAALPNGRDGIYLDDTDDSQIGDGTDAARNYVTGNTGAGIVVSNDASNVSILNNYIGLDDTGVNDLGNGLEGINMTGANQNQVIGNIIAGNGSHGIAVQNAATSDNVIQQNTIGLNVNNAKISNEGDGIYLDNCKNNFIGGLAGEGNVVSGNLGYGISLNGADSDLNKIGDNKIGIDPATNAYNIGNGKSGIYISSNATNNVIGDNGSTSAGNIIAGNEEHGVEIDGSVNNSIDGNIIGMNDALNQAHKNGVTCLAGDCAGIYITNGASNNQIGVISKNTIAGDHQYQILIDDGANGNKIQNNDIGLDNTVITNGESIQTAIRITGNGTDNNEIGLTQAEGNLIVHSSNQAVLIDAGASGNKVSGNTFIGSTGSSPESAITIENADANIIGGVADDTGNIIEKTSADAITVSGTSNQNEIQTNFIGTNADGSAASGPVIGHGIVLDGPGVTSTLVFNNTIGTLNDATKSAIYVNGIGGSSEIYGNYLGVTKSDVDVANAGNAITIENNATGVSIGKTGENPNVIGNSALNGIEIIDATNTTIINNYIGTNVAGTAAKTNTLEGIQVGSGNTGLTITENVISGNTNNGILVDNDVAGTNAITDNHIGFNANADGTFTNGIHAIKFDGATTNFTVSGNEIGGHTENAIEVVNSQNITFTSNFIGTNSIATTAFANAKNGIRLGTGSGDITVGADNVISGNTENGILVDANLTGTNAISESIIGMNGTEDGALANGLDGIAVETTQTNLTIADNSIGGNTEHGIEIEGVTGGVTISGNSIGVGTGDANVGNTLNGIEITGTSSDISVTGANVIGFNTQGINIDDATTITVAQNLIGTTAAGANVGNTVNGINVANATGITASTNAIGFNVDGIYLSTGSGDITVNTTNVISGNTANGIFVDVSLSGTNTITGNTIGLDATQAAALGNGEHGIKVVGNTGNLTISDNFIGGNTNGIDLDASTGTSITGNTIGLGVGNENVGNTTNGIAVNNGADNTTISTNTIDNNVNGITVNASRASTISDNTIGGADTQTLGINLVSGAASQTIETNTISHHTTDGIVVDAASSTENTITQNSMFCNGPSTNFGDGTGITLSNSGNNGFATGISTTRPEMKLKDSNAGGNSSVSLDLATFAGAQTIEVFQNDTDCDNCQGRTYLGDATITGTTATYDLGVVLTDPATCDDYVVTVTDANGNTSEFSACSECNCTEPQDNPQYDAATQALTGFATGTLETCDPNTITLGAEEDLSEAPTTDFYYAWYKGDPTADASSWTEVKAPAQNDFTFTADPANANHGDGDYFFVVSFTGDPESCAKISDPITLQFNPSYDPTTADISYCKDETPAGDLSSQVTATNSGLISWYTAATGGTASTTAPTATTTAAGTTSHWVTETVLGCEGGRIEFVVTVNDLFTPTGTVADACEGTIAPTLTATAANSGTLTWYTAATGGTGSATAPSLSTGTAGTTSYYVTETVNSCEGPRHQIDFTVNANPTVTFDPLSSLCSADAAITLATVATVNPTGGIFSYDGNDETSFDPTGKGGTTTTITYTYTDANGCINSATETIDVTNAIQPTISGATSYCEGSGGSATLTASGANTYTWSTGETTASITVDPNTTTEYTVTSIDANGCENTNSATITVNPLPNVSATTTDADLCAGESTQLTASGASTYIWDNGLSSTATVNASPATTTTYTVTGRDANGCENTATQTITVTEIPVASLTLPSTICYDEAYTAEVEDLNSNTSSVSVPVWTFNGSSVNTTSKTISKSASEDKESGTYTVKLTANGCESAPVSSSISITTPEASIALTSGKDYIKEGESISMVANGGNTDYSYTWTNLSTGSVESNSNPVTFTPLESTTYTVTATLDGCEAEASQFIKVRGAIVIPNGFSPNGDGLNETWIIKNIEEYENAIVRVYNRWGNLIYESDPGYKIPWDGLRENGEKMPIATYYYIVELNVDNEEYAGSVTIVR